MELELYINQLGGAFCFPFVPCFVSLSLSAPQPPITSHSIQILSLIFQIYNMYKKQDRKEKKRNKFPPSSITITPNSLDSAIIYSQVQRMGVAGALFDHFINIKFHIKIHFYISPHSLHQILSCLVLQKATIQGHLMEKELGHKNENSRSRIRAGTFMFQGS